MPWLGVLLLLIVGFACNGESPSGLLFCLSAIVFAYSLNLWSLSTKLRVDVPEIPLLALRYMAYTFWLSANLAMFFCVFGLVSGSIEGLSNRYAVALQVAMRFFLGIGVDGGLCESWASAWAVTITSLLGSSHAVVFIALGFLRIEERRRRAST